MAYFFKKDSMEFKPHPRFKGVGFLPLIDKAQDQGLSVSMLEIEPGIEIPIHIHETQADSIYVLSGEGQAFVNGEWQAISEGDYILVPSGEEHGVKNTGNQVLKLFIVHVPPLF
ncbi:hypothetical protein DBT_1694 [Dissulfuribacter thermophilus]|uniref:Cupin type-2 domain-containing protein n=1 Tax=Dissulfuribacter thermophilus TaxID=1156395 RepID=A0A1B9F4M2_9BACT|nr:cupin domain-containing protein [Dissulfuribacter thermophilus]OCC14899.1 hypothetical protein DBT_1694 [Dissulfuribacter thermophilus]